MAYSIQVRENSVLNQKPPKHLPPCPTEPGYPPSSRARVTRFANNGNNKQKLKEIDRWQNKLCHANRVPMQFVH